MPAASSSLRLPPLWRPGLLWLAVLAPLFFISYGFANHRAAALPAVPSIVFDWERHIPLWPWTILPYWSIDLFYGLSLLVCRTRLELTRHALRLLTAQLVCVGGFLLFPLRFSTPRPAVDGWAGSLFDALAGFDLPYNQAPSLHIVLALILWDFYRRHLRGPARGVVHVWSALIGVSVLTTYQHHAIDIPTGLLAGALCLWLWPLEGPRPALWPWTAQPQRRRLALLYGAAALGLALAAGTGRPLWWLYWPAASLALVAVCYAGPGAAGFQKRANGRHSVAVRLLMAPHRLGAWVNARCWTRRLPASVPVEGHVWLGRLPLPWEADHRRFERLVDVTSELASHRHPGSHSAGWLDLVDPEPSQLLAAAEAVQHAATRGPVLVCCALGFSRSAAVVATWAGVHGGCADVDGAVEKVRQARPEVVMKPGLLKAVAQAIALGKAGAR
jgi:protein-tyrosine phosphatase/membrane-associated phospholipid phosphatase